MQNNRRKEKHPLVLCIAEIFRGLLFVIMETGGAL